MVIETHVSQVPFSILRGKTGCSPLRACAPIRPPARDRVFACQCKHRNTVPSRPVLPRQQVGPSQVDRARWCPRVLPSRSPRQTKQRGVGTWGCVRQRAARGAGASTSRASAECARAMPCLPRRGAVRGSCTLPCEERQARARPKPVDQRRGRFKARQPAASRSRRSAGRREVASGAGVHACKTRGGLFRPTAAGTPATGSLLKPGLVGWSILQPFDSFNLMVHGTPDRDCIGDRSRIGIELQRSTNIHSFRVSNCHTHVALLVIPVPWSTWIQGDAGCRCNAVQMHRPCCVRHQTSAAANRCTPTRGLGLHIFGSFFFSLGRLR